MAKKTSKKAAAKTASTKAKTAKKASKAKTAAKKAAKKVAKKTATKTAAKKVAKAKTATKTATKTVKKATKKTVKKAAKKTTRKVPAKKKAVSVKVPKTPLTKKELAEYHDMLMAKRRTLLGDMTGMEAEALRGNTSTGEHSSMPVHMADIGTDNYEQEFTLGLLESERQLLREIDESLEQMVQGTYGVCMGTGNPIGKARLRAKPWAKYSIEYVRKIEQGLVRIPARDYGVAAAQESDDFGDD